MREAMLRCAAALNCDFEIDGLEREMARLAGGDRSQNIRSREGKARSQGEGRSVFRYIQSWGAAVFGYIWASFLIAASAAETLLSRLLTKYR